MALESLPKIAPALFSAEQDLIQIYNKKTDTVGTINASLIGTPPSGVSGAIQFSNGSAFASDAANLFWDNTNKRLGVGTNVPTSPFTLIGASQFGNAVGSGSIETFDGFYSMSFGKSTSIYNPNNNHTRIFMQSSQTFVDNTSGNFQFRSAGSTVMNLQSGNLAVGNGSDSILARTHIKGSGSTSATTSLLVQNSAGTAAMTVKDDLSTEFGGSTKFNTLMEMKNGSFLFEATNANYSLNVNGFKFGNSTGLLFHSAGANSGSADTGFIRSASGTLKVTNGSTGYGSIDTSLYKVSGTNGFTGTGSYTNFTIVGGIITNAS